MPPEHGEIVARVRRAGRRAGRGECPLQGAVEGAEVVGEQRSRRRGVGASEAESEHQRIGVGWQ